jgi:hypothetical protein
MIDELRAGEATDWPLEWQHREKRRPNLADPNF